AQSVYEILKKSIFLSIFGDLSAFRGSCAVPCHPTDPKVSTDIAIRPLYKNTKSKPLKSFSFLNWMSHKIKFKRVSGAYTLTASDTAGQLEVKSFLKVVEV
ncbi:hypothetical protein P3392_24470, partial [Vibrio parahaemolyticus]|nr:hypothetical protein [Vibrio parahaemolyticus]